MERIRGVCPFLDVSYADLKIRVATVHSLQFRAKMTAFQHHPAGHDKSEGVMDSAQQSLCKHLIAHLASTAEPVFKKPVQGNDLYSKFIGIVFIGVHDPP